MVKEDDSIQNQEILGTTSSLSKGKGCGCLLFIVIVFLGLFMSIGSVFNTLSSKETTSASTNTITLEEELKNELDSSVEKEIEKEIETVEVLEWLVYASQRLDEHYLLYNVEYSEGLNKYIRGDEYLGAVIAGDVSYPEAGAYTMYLVLTDKTLNTVDRAGFRQTVPIYRFATDEEISMMYMKDIKAEDISLQYSDEYAGYIDYVFGMGDEAYILRWWEEEDKPKPNFEEGILKVKFTGEVENIPVGGSWYDARVLELR